MSRIKIIDLEVDKGLIKTCIESFDSDESAQRIADFINSIKDNIQQQIDMHYAMLELAEKIMDMSNKRKNEKTCQGIS